MDFMERVRTNDAPSIEEYQTNYPQFAEDIRSQFPGIMLAEKLANKTKWHEERQIALPFKLGQFELVEEIGRGGMGVVYKAHHLDLDADFAVKLIKTEGKQADPKRAQRFRQEAKLISSLHHRCIVPLVDFGNADGNLYFAMRLIEGITFRELMYNWSTDEASNDQMFRQLRNNWTLLASLFSEIADALHYIHGNNLIHRDVKPSNLMIDEDSRVWISDFGLSTSLGTDWDRVTTSGVAGTPRYFPPECIRGNHDQRSDIYSLGVTMFEMLSGVEAFGAECQRFGNRLSLPSIRQVNQGVPRPLARIVDKACRANPCDRFQSAQEMAILLRNFALGVRSNFFKRVLSGPFFLNRKKTAAS